MIFRLIVVFALLDSVEVQVIRGSSSQDEFPFSGRSQQRKLLSVSSAWYCGFVFGGDLRCDWEMNTTDPSTGQTSFVNAVLTCVGADESAVDFRSATGCTCVAEVRPGNAFAMHECGCSVCSDNRSTDVLNVDCSKEIVQKPIVDNCLTFDCDLTCNGVCTDECPAEANDDPNCETCPRPTGAPTTARPTKAPTTSAPTTVSPTVQPTFPPPTVSPTTSAPTVSPTTSAPTVSPTTSAPTITSAPTVSPTTSAPTITSAPTVSPTTIPPTVSPTTAGPTLTIRTGQPTVAGQAALGTFVVETEGTPGLGQAGVLATTVSTYLRQELRATYPNLLELSIVVLNDVDDAVEYQAVATFKADAPIPPMADLIELQRKTLENFSKYAEFVEAGNFTNSGVVVKSIRAEGPAPRGRLVVKSEEESGAGSGAGSEGSA